MALIGKSGELCGIRGAEAEPEIFFRLIDADSFQIAIGSNIFLPYKGAEQRRFSQAGVGADTIEIQGLVKMCADKSAGAFHFRGKRFFFSERTEAAVQEHQTGDGGAQELFSVRRFRCLYAAAPFYAEDCGMQIPQQSEERFITEDIRSGYERSDVPVFWIDLRKSGFFLCPGGFPGLRFPESLPHEIFHSLLGDIQTAVVQQTGTGCAGVTVSGSKTEKTDTVRQYPSFLKKS